MRNDFWVQYATLFWGAGTSRPPDAPALVLVQQQRSIIVTQPSSSRTAPTLRESSSDCRPVTVQRRRFRGTSCSDCSGVSSLAWPSGIRRTRPAFGGGASPWTARTVKSLSHHTIATTIRIRACSSVPLQPSLRHTVVSRPLSNRTSIRSRPPKTYNQHLTPEQTSAVRKAQELLDERLYPLGDFTFDDLEVAKDLFYFFRNQQHDSDSNHQRNQYHPELVNVSLDLWFRCMREIIETQPTHHLYFGQPRYYAPLLNDWKETAKRSANQVLSPHDLLNKLKEMHHYQNSELPSSSLLFHWDIVVLNIILNAVIAQTPRAEVPLAAERLLDWIEDQAAVEIAGSKEPRLLQPTAYTYNPILMAWARSGRPEAPQRMEGLVQRMQQHGVARTVITYRSFLVCARRQLQQPSTAKRMIRDTLRKMRAEGLEPSVVDYQHAVAVYAQAGDVRAAMEILDHLMRMPQPEVHHVVGDGAHEILLALRSSFNGPGAIRGRRKANVMRRAQRLMHKVLDEYGLHHRHGDSVSQDRMLGVWMDMLALTGNVRETEELFRRSESPDIVKCGIMVKCYGKAGEAERATELLQELIRAPTFSLNVSLFNAVIGAWGDTAWKSGDDDVMDQVDKVMEMMKECGLEPNDKTFSMLLRVLSHSKRRDAGALAEKILDDLEGLFRTTNNIPAKPSIVAYNLALRASYRVGDLECAQRIMQRMEQAGTIPNVRSYNEILAHFGQIGTVEAAERCEAILQHMLTLAKNNSNPNLKPNSVSCNIAIGAWARTNHETASDRMWKIFTQTMPTEGIHPNLVFYRCLLKALLKSSEQQQQQSPLPPNRAVDLDRADQIMRLIESWQPVDRVYNEKMRARIQEAQNKSSSGGDGGGDDHDSNVDDGTSASD